MKLNNLIVFDGILFVIFGILLFAFFLPILKKLKYGQSVRTLGPKEHYKKSGTPTMGGIIILICILIFYSLLIIELKNYFHIELNKCFLILLLIIMMELDRTLNLSYN